MVWCRVTRHPRVFRGLTGYQRNPWDRGVIAMYQSLGKRLPRELECGYTSSSQLGIKSLGTRVPRDDIMGLDHALLCVACFVLNMLCDMYGDLCE